MKNQSLFGYQQAAISIQLFGFSCKPQAASWELS